MEKKQIWKRTLKINVQYQLYIELSSKKRSELIYKNAKLKERVNKLKEYLNNHKTLIETHCDESYKDIVESTNLNDLADIKKELENPLVVLYLTELIKSNKEIKVNLIEIKKLNNKIISFKIYKKIIEKFNDKIFTLIVDKNYLFCPDKRFGSIGVVKSNNKTKQIDWGKSTKIKNALLKAGKKPYYKGEAEKAAKEGKEYDGVEWKVYLPDTNFFYYWFTTRIKKFFPIIKDYRFIPARSISYNSPVVKLTKAKENLTKAMIQFTRTVNDKPC